jgi:hypothetical protein
MLKSTLGAGVLLAFLLVVLFAVSAESKKVLWGALVGSQFTGKEAPGDMRAITAFEKRNAGGKKMTAIHHGGNWYGGGCGQYCKFDTIGLGNIVKHGALPFYSWASTNTGNPKDPKFRNAAVASGAHDSYIRQWAKDAKAFGRKVVVALNWEMNGNWYPWSPQPGANGPASDYVNAWRHVHNIIRKEVGAKNVQFAWVPNIDPGNGFAAISGFSLASMYPGSSYVDMVGLDGYNGNDPTWRSFKDLYASTYQALLRIAPKKPVIILEVGCTEKGGSKPQWIADMFKVLPKSFPKVKALMWYNRKSIGPGNHKDWPVESKPKSSAAFKNGIKSARY